MLNRMEGQVCGLLPECKRRHWCGRLAENLRRRGTNLVLRRGDWNRLQEVADGLRKKHGSRTHVGGLGPGQREARRKFSPFTKEKGLTLDLLSTTQASVGQLREFRRWKRSGCWTWFK